MTPAKPFFPTVFAAGLASAQAATLDPGGRRRSDPRREGGTLNRAQPFAARYGPWALVTGASDGIGQAFARSLAAQGLNLVIVARRQNLLESLATELEATWGIECRVVAADLSQQQEVLRVHTAVADVDLGLLVMAAGFGTSGELATADLADELSMLQVNCAATLMLTRLELPRLVRKGRGGIVLMSSLLGFMGVPRAAHYAATKAYVQSLAEGLRVELRPLGIDVVASAPGPVHSGFAARADMHLPAGVKPEAVAAGTLQALGSRGTVRPGFLSKLMAWSMGTLPRWARVHIMARVMGGITAHQATGAGRRIGTSP